MGFLGEALDEARAQDAVVLCACATVCFRGLNNPYLELHAVAASVKFHQRRGDIPAAMKHIKNGRKLLKLAETYFDSLEAQVESFRSSHEDQEAVSLCFAAKDWERGISGVQDMLQRDSIRLDDMKSSDDPHIWYTMVHIACILEQNGDIGRALEWYLSAFHVVETNRPQLADIKDRRDILSTVSSGELFIGMARIAFKFSEVPDSSCGPSQQWTLTPAEWKDQGLRFLELGRSRTLLDLLIVRKLAPPDLKVWSKYSYQLGLKEKKSSTKDTTETKSQDRIDKEPESRVNYLERIYVELMEELESPSLSKLLPEPAAVRESNEKLYQCIPETAIVLHISSNREGLIILCITSQGIIDIHTAEITALQLDRYIFRFAKLFRDVKYPGSSSLPAIATCNQYIQAISNEIIEPVSRHIETKEHVIFIPSPSLNKFPLSALIYKMEPLFISKDVSQKKHRLSKKVSVIYKDPESTHGGALDISTSAAIKIAGSFHAKPQAATKTFTKDMFIEVYQQSDILLIATHGDQSTKSAWESSILLHPPFQVLDLARLHSNATLIIFEACVSGLGEESIGNDLLGFSHAVLASDATAFLGGLWKVSDEASALLMLFLAEEVRTNKGSKSLARCWRNAQIRLYKLNVEGEVAILEDMKNCLEAYQAKLIDEKLAAQLRQTVEDFIEDVQELGANFAHPFYWAPFVLMGHSGLVLDFDEFVETGCEVLAL
ncbi:CHAT domain-containing protein [Leptodontidium sp. 2 PMI_412]|nr:CHAT domain-containing protein [Leptodontidium sp. 2 PMI_412]